MIVVWEFDCHHCHRHKLLGLFLGVQAGISAGDPKQQLESEKHMEHLKMKEQIGKKNINET